MKRVIWPATAHACPIDFPKEAEDDRYSPIGYDPENGYRQLPFQQSFDVLAQKELSEWADATDIV